MVTWQAWLFGLLVYPVLEELVFRAGLLRWADGRWPRWRGWRTNLTVSVVFGLAHAWAWPWMHAVAVVAPSFVLGWLMQRYRSLALCVAVHAAFNAVRYAAAPWI